RRRRCRYCGNRLPGRSLPRRPPRDRELATPPVPAGACAARCSAKPPERGSSCEWSPCVDPVTFALRAAPPCPCFRILPRAHGTRPEAVPPLCLLFTHGSVRPVGFPHRMSRQRGGRRPVGHEQRARVSAELTQGRTALVERIVAEVYAEDPAYRTLHGSQLSEVRAITAWLVSRSLELWVAGERKLPPQDVERLRGIGRTR